MATKYSLYREKPITLKELNKKKLYSANQLSNNKLFENKGVDVYPNHYSVWNNKENKYETFYELRATTTKEKENFPKFERNE